jgi:hypothetical protein
MSSKSASLALFATMAVVAPHAMMAQSAVDGAIGGTVEDQTGATIPKATVTIHADSTNAEQKVVADDAGFFRVIHLTPGSYTVTVSADGFEAYKANNVIVTVGSLTSVKTALTIGSKAETIEVSTQPPAINTTNNDFSSTIGLKVLEDLPVNNYRWSSYALLTPGVVADSNGFGLLSFRGQSTLLNNVTFDGADDNQAFFSEERGRTRVGYSTAKASIQEFQVNTSNYSVEYGRSAGGVVNAVTRSGSNQIHGEAYFFDRDAEWGAKNQFTTLTSLNSNGTTTTNVIKPKDWRKQTGIGIGGPIIKDKLFYFFAFDKFLRNFPALTAPSSLPIFYATVPAAPNGTNGTCAGLTTATAAGAVCTLAAQLNGTPVTNSAGQAGTTAIPLANVTAAQYTAAYNTYTTGIAGLNTMFGLTPRTGDQDIFFPKLDWQVNGKNHVTLEVNRLRWTSPAGIQTGTSTLSYGKESLGNDFVKDTFGIAKLDTAITSHLSNEIRYQYGRDFEYEFNQTPTPYEQSVLLTPAGYTNPFGIPPLVTITNAFGSGFGTATFLNRPAYPDERRWQIADTANLVRGNHNLKFGVDLIHTHDLSQNLTAVFGSFGYTGANYGALEQYFTDLNKTNACGGAECYGSYSQGFGPLGFQFNTNDYAGFVQDEWKVNPRLSLTLGVRYEYEQTPSPQIPNTAAEATLAFPNGSTNAFPDNRTNFGPRVGFALDVFGTGKTVLRGGVGEFFARLENSTIYNAIAQTGNSLGQLQVSTASSTTQFGSNSVTKAPVYAPLFPQILSSTNLALSGSSAVIYFNKNFKMPEIQQADLTVEQDMGFQTTFGITWLASYGRRLPDFRDDNLPAPSTTVSYTVAAGGPIAAGTVIKTPYYKALTAATGCVITPPSTVCNGRPDSRYATETDIFSGVNSNYEGLVVYVKHQVTRGLTFNANYTWSHALDYGENNTTFSSSNSLLDPRNLRAEYGNSNQNIPNRFVFYAIYNTPSAFKGILGYLLNDYEIAPSYQTQNGLPYSAGVSGTSTGLVLDDGTKLGTTGNAPASTSAGVNGTGGTARVPGTDRNIFQFRKDEVLDLRLSKRFKVRDYATVELLGESFNLFNHQNVTGVSSTNAYGFAAGSLATGTANATPNQLTYNTSFGVINNVNSNLEYSPRQVQLGVRVQF